MIGVQRETETYKNTGKEKHDRNLPYRGTETELNDIGKDLGRKQREKEIQGKKQKDGNNEFHKNRKRTQ